MTYHAFTATSRASEDNPRQRPLREWLTHLGKPLLVMEAKVAILVSPADYCTVSGATVELLPSVGHSPIPEDPPRTAASLLPFLAAHAARAH